MNNKQQNPNSIDAKTAEAQTTANTTGRKMYLYERLDGRGYGFRVAQDRDRAGVGTIIWPRDENGEWRKPLAAALLLLLALSLTGPTFTSDPDNDDAHPESSVCLPCPPPPPLGGA